MTAAEQLVVERVGVSLSELVCLVEGADDRTWRARARCHGVDPTQFFPERGQSTRPAKGFCAACPVAARCLAYALREHEVLGIFGGTSPGEHREIRRAVAAVRAKRRSEAA